METWANDAITIGLTLTEKAWPFFVFYKFCCLLIFFRFLSIFCLLFHQVILDVSPRESPGFHVNIWSLGNGLSEGRNLPYQLKIYHHVLQKNCFSCQRG